MCNINLLSDLVRKVYYARLKGISLGLGRLVGLRCGFIHCRRLRSFMGCIVAFCRFLSAIDFCSIVATRNGRLVPGISAILISFICNLLENLVIQHILFFNYSDE